MSNCRSRTESVACAEPQFSERELEKLLNYSQLFAAVGCFQRNITIAIYVRTFAFTHGLSHFFGRVVVFHASIYVSNAISNDPQPIQTALFRNADIG